MLIESNGHDQPLLPIKLIGSKHSNDESIMLNVRKGYFFKFTINIDYLLDYIISKRHELNDVLPSVHFVFFHLPYSLSQSKLLREFINVNYDYLDKIFLEYIISRSFRDIYQGECDAASDTMLKMCPLSLLEESRLSSNPKRGTPLAIKLKSILPEFKVRHLKISIIDTVVHRIRNHSNNNDFETPTSNDSTISEQDLFNSSLIASPKKVASPKPKSSPKVIRRQTGRRPLFFKNLTSFFNSKSSHQLNSPSPTILTPKYKMYKETIKAVIHFSGQFATLENPELINRLSSHYATRIKESADRLLEYLKKREITLCFNPDSKQQLFEIYQHYYCALTEICFPLPSNFQSKFNQFAVTLSRTASRLYFSHGITSFDGSLLRPYVDRIPHMNDEYGVILNASLTKRKKIKRPSSQRYTNIYSRHCIGQMNPFDEEQLQFSPEETQVFDIDQLVSSEESGFVMVQKTPSNQVLTPENALRDRYVMLNRSKNRFNPSEDYYLQLIKNHLERLPGP